MTISAPQHPWRGIRKWQRHGLVLMVAGLVFVGIGFSYIFTDITTARRISLSVILQTAPMPFWGSLFILAGVLSIVSSRWPPISKTWGYMVLSGLSAGWALAYLLGMITPRAINWLNHWFDLPNPFPTAPWGNLSAVASWGLISFMWVAISGLINADDVLQRPILVEDDGDLIDPKELI